ncbi:MAG TPA: 50S ribosomal protein L22 [Candidatus Azoamicus sp. OHIO1]
MIVKSVVKNARISQRKVRFVVDRIRGISVERAIDFLNFSNKKASFILKKLLRSAVANAEHNYGLDIDELFVHCVYVNKATMLKRFKPRAKGRSNRIVKRSCHIFIGIKERK